MFKKIEKKGHGYMIHSRGGYEAMIFFDPALIPLNKADVASISDEIHSGSGGRLLCIIDFADYGIIRLITNTAMGFDPEIGINEDDAIELIVDKMANSV